MRTLLALAMILAATTAEARANPLAGFLIEVSFRASVEITSRLTLETTTEETSPRSAPCERRRRYSTCMTLDPQVGDQLVREAYAFDGPLLREMADGLEVTPERLAQSIVTRLPAAPTRSDLTRVIVTVAPDLERS